MMDWISWVGIFWIAAFAVCLIFWDWMLTLAMMLVHLWCQQRRIDMNTQLNEHSQSEVLFWHLMSNRNTGFALVVDGDRGVVVVEEE